MSNKFLTPLLEFHFLASICISTSVLTMKMYNSVPKKAIFVEPSLQVHAKEKMIKVNHKVYDVEFQKYIIVICML